jgi:hypothetical protein
LRFGIRPFWPESLKEAEEMLLSWQGHSHLHFPSDGKVSSKGA